MSELISKAKEQVVIYWLLGFYFMLFTASALASCILASLIGADLSSLDRQGKWMIALAVFGNWSTIMLAFFNKAAARITSGQLPIAPDDAGLIPKPLAGTQNTRITTSREVEQTTVAPATAIPNTNEIKQ